MSRNRYLQVARLASHPAFCMYHCESLHCPLCPEVFGRVGEYDKHVLAHPDLTAEVAYKKLSGRTWDRVAPKRGWTEPSSGVGESFFNMRGETSPGLTIEELCAVGDHAYHGGAHLDAPDGDNGSCYCGKRTYQAGEPAPITSSPSGDVGKLGAS